MLPGFPSLDHGIDTSYGSAGQRQIDGISRLSSVAHKSHALPQFPFLLLRLQLQPLNRILQPLLLLLQPLHLQRPRVSQRGALRRRRRRSRTVTYLPTAAGLVVAILQPPLKQIRARPQTLLLARQLVDVILRGGEQLADGRGDLVDERLLGFTQLGLWEQLKVLLGLQDLAEAREVVDAFIEDGDAGFEEREG